MHSQILTGLKPGVKVLVDGQRYEARGLVSDGRMFVDATTGDELFLPGSVQRGMAAHFRLTLDDLPKNIEESIARARAASFSAFDLVQRTVALRRLRYIQAVDARPSHLRRRTAEIEDCIAVVFDELSKEANSTETPGGGTFPRDAADSAAAEGAEPEVDDVGLVPDDDADRKTRAQVIQEKLMAIIARGARPGDARVPLGAVPPTPRSVRRWYRLYYASGQDIRVLLDHHALKGNRLPRYPEWVADAINRVIDENIAVPTPVRYSKALDLACHEVRQSKAPDAALPAIAKSRGGEDLLGQNLIARWVRQRNRYELDTAHVGIYEARRRFSAVELGPQGDWPNHQWEVDHTLLDLLVIDEESEHVHGRPWLTAIIDRYTRCIVGFSLSFAPPSWISVADALRIAIVKKDKLIEHLNEPTVDKYKIRNPWDCHGIPTFLVTDHGREFKSRSMDETLAILNTTPFQAKKKKPWLKGKIERWFGELQEEFSHTVPGTTFSKFEKRKFYQSEEFAVVTLPEVNWIVTKWVVDVYNQRPHGKLRRPPAEMWRLGIQHQLPRTLPPELLRPAMGLVLDRCLRRGGVKFAGMRWDSKAFGLLRETMPADADVQIRLDPRDLSRLYVWDEARSDWIEGRLKEPVEAAKYNLDQWYYIDTRRKENMRLGLERKEALQTAIAEIQEFIREVGEGLTGSKAYKRYLVNVHRHRSAWEMMLPENWELENDGPPGAHVLGPSPMLAMMETGPFREPPPPPAEEDAGDFDSRDENGSGNAGSAQSTNHGAQENAGNGSDDNAEAPRHPEPAAKRTRTAEPKSRPAAAPGNGSSHGTEAKPVTAATPSQTSPAENSPPTAQPAGGDETFHDDDFSKGFTVHDRSRDT